MFSLRCKSTKIRLFLAIYTEVLYRTKIFRWTMKPKRPYRSRVLLRLFRIVKYGGLYLRTGLRPYLYEVEHLWRIPGFYNKEMKP